MPLHAWLAKRLEKIKKLTITLNILFNFRYQDFISLQLVKVIAIIIVFDSEIGNS